MKPSEALQAARALIEDRGNWCKGALMIRTLDGHERRCAFGAANAVPGGMSFPACDYLTRAAEAVVDDRYDPKKHNPVTHINDECGHAAVMDLYDVAISAALSDEAAL